MKTTDSAPHNYILHSNVNYRAPFRFDAEHGTIPCTYVPMPQGNPLITWGAHRSSGYTDEQCRSNVESGEWKVIDDSKEALTNTFRFTSKYASDSTFIYDPKRGMSMVGNDYYVPCSQQTARDAIANGAWLVLPSEPASKASIDSIHNYVEQACTQTQSRLNVLFLGGERYSVYHMGLLDAEIDVQGEESLREAVEALLVLDGKCKW